MQYIILLKFLHSLRHWIDNLLIAWKSTVEFVHGFLKKLKSFDTSRNFIENKTRFGYPRHWPWDLAQEEYECVYTSISCTIRIGQAMCPVWAWWHEILQQHVAISQFNRWRKRERLHGFLKIMLLGSDVAQDTWGKKFMHSLSLFLS